MPTTKHDLIETLNQVGDSVAEMLNPALSRQDIVTKLQELDNQLNDEDDGSDDDEADDESYEG